jgi:hypothetical protein
LGRKEQENTPATEESRRGGHLWFFFDQLVPGKMLRIFGAGLMERFSVKVEMYPKQDRIGKGVGSLIRLPFGVHRLSGKRYGFITPDGQPLAPTLREQLRILEHVETVPLQAIQQYPVRSPKKERKISLGGKTWNT